MKLSLYTFVRGMLFYYTVPIGQDLFYVNHRTRVLFVRLQFLCIYNLNMMQIEQWLTEIFLKFYFKSNRLIPRFTHNSWWQFLSISEYETYNSLVNCKTFWVLFSSLTNKFRAFRTIHDDRYVKSIHRNFFLFVWLFNICVWKGSSGSFSFLPRIRTVINYPTYRGN